MQPFCVILEREMLPDLGMAEVMPVAENRFFKFVEEPLEFVLVRECIELRAILDAETHTGLLGVFNDRKQPISNPGI